jgi:ATP-dependent protease ClpP protease subunit
MNGQTPWRTARVYALGQSGRNDWYRIRNQADGPTQLHIYDEIGYFGVTAQDMIRDLAAVEGALEVHINSPGGEVFDGVAIYNTLLARDNVTVVIDGLAASAASFIAMAGKPLLVAKTAQMMIHDGHGMAIGNAADMRELADVLDKTSDNIAAIYFEKAGYDIQYWREKMQAETWYTGQEIVDAGLADGIYDARASKAPVAANFDLSVFKHPQGGREVVQPANAASEPYVGRTQARHAPMTGTHSHDHGAHGASDHDDGVHEHTHTHNNDASHDHSDQHSGPDYDGGKSHGTSYYDKNDKEVRNQEVKVDGKDDWSDEEVQLFINTMKEVKL